MPQPFPGTGRGTLMDRFVLPQVACAGPATVVYDDELGQYDFGGEHPMSPLRVKLTMELAGDLGVLGEHLRQIEAPMATLEQIATVHSQQYIEAVTRVGNHRGAVDLDHGLGTEDNPAFLGMH